jgi:hypothetical protein
VSYRRFPAKSKGASRTKSPGAGPGRFAWDQSHSGARDDRGRSKAVVHANAEHVIVRRVFAEPVSVVVASMICVKLA